MKLVIVGCGRMGAALAHTVLRRGHGVTVIDRDSESFVRLTPCFSGETITGIGFDREVLLRAGIERVAGLARFEFSVRRIIARVNQPANSWMFTREMGVDVALNQADLLAHLILEELSVGEMMTLIKLRKGAYTLVEEKVHPRSSAAGKTIAALALPAESVITALIRNGSLLIPRGDLVLLAEDEVLAVVHSARLARLAQVLGPDGHENGNGQP